MNKGEHVESWENDNPMALFPDAKERKFLLHKKTDHPPLVPMCFGLFRQRDCVQKSYCVSELLFFGFLRVSSEKRKLESVVPWRLKRDRTHGLPRNGRTLAGGDLQSPTTVFCI
jgi:hypothetical protein